MGVQNSAALDSSEFVLFSSDLGVRKDAETLLQDAGRSGDLVRNTLMAKIAASQKWVPFSDETATDGSAIPQGIYVGDDITEADIVAGDVVDLPIILSGIRFDKNKLVIENSKLLTTVITVGTTDLRTVEDHLFDKLLIPEDTIAGSRAEN